MMRAPAAFARMPLAFAFAFTFAGSASPHAASAASTTATMPAAPAPQPTPDAPPTPTPQPAPVFGDLSHLEATATADLHADIVDAPPGDASPSLSLTISIATGPGQIPELRVNGDVVALTHLGKRAVENKTGRVTYTFYGVPLLAGPNDVAACAVGARGRRSDVSHAVIYGPGVPVTLHADLESKAVADGKTPIRVRLVGIDRWGHYAAAGSSISVAVDSGDVTLFNVPEDRAITGRGQATLDVILEPSGKNVLTLLPGLRAGDVALRLETHDAQGSLRFFLPPYVRPALVNGLVTAGLGSLPAAPADPAGATDGADSKRARVALFATGQITAGAVATVAYDTANTLQRSTGTGAFVDDPNARPYPTSGDTSLRREDAYSRDHLFIHIDAGRSSLTWGEFQAQTGPATGGLGGFNLLVQGANLTLANARTKLTAFHAQNDVAYGRAVFSPTGLSTAANVLEPNIVIASDSVTLVALDRRTGAVVSQTPFVRNVDYTLDYASGVLRFITIPLPYDEHFNPQEILVRYEYQSPGSHARTDGGRFESSLGRGPSAIHAGIGYASDATGAGSLQLFGQDVGGGLNGGSWSFEHLTSQGLLPSQTLGSGIYGTSGDAYRFAFDETHGADRISAHVDATSTGFNNPFGGLSTPGLIDEDVTLAHEIDRKHDLIDMSFDHLENVATSVTVQTDATVHVRHGLGRRVVVNAGITETSATGSAPAPASTGAPAPAAGQQSNLHADVGVDWKPSTAVTVSLARRTNLTGADVADTPDETSAQVAIALPHSDGKFYVRQLWSASPTSSFASATQQLAAPVLGTSATEFGFERPMGNTVVSDDYAIARTANGTDVTSAMGVKEVIAIAKRLRGNATIQRGANAGAPSANATGTSQTTAQNVPSLNGSFMIYGLALTYADPNGRIRANTSYQLRTGNDPGASLTAGVAGAISGALSTFVTAQSSRGNGITNDDFRLGLALRPVNDDRNVSLLAFEKEDGNTTTEPARTDVLSFEQLERLTPSTEIAARLAYKLDGDGYYAAHSSMIALRVVQKIARRSDIAAEVTGEGIAGIGGAGVRGFALENGYRIGDQMRFAVGYSFAGTVDPLLATAPGRRGVYVTVTSIVDRIFGWGRSLEALP
jgi:hypothetical protein